VKWFTLSIAGQERFSGGNPSTRQAPGKGRQSDALPSKIGRKYKETCHCICATNLLAERAEKIAVANATVGAEHYVSDEVNQHRHDSQAEKQEAGQQGQLFGGDLPEVI
jgi:hypothetical protein